MHVEVCLDEAAGPHGVFMTRGRCLGLANIHTNHRSQMTPACQWPLGPFVYSYGIFPKVRARWDPLWSAERIRRAILAHFAAHEIVDLSQFVHNKSATWLLSR